MLIKNDKGVYIFEKFPQDTDLVHGFSTRAFGSMRPSDPISEKSRQTFAQALEIDSQQIVRMDQVHGIRFTWITSADGGTEIVKTDSLLSREAHAFLSVLSADCLPILLYDKSKKYIGVVHAGWKGIFNEIIKEAVSEMITQGSKPEDILVGMGPCIRVCCYNVTSERQKLFQGKFDKWDGYIVEKEEKIFLDLPLLAKQQLQALGVLEENIDDSQICTADNTSEFYSYRKEGEHTGRFIGLIGRS